jgi:lipoprotein-releasing system permease protein
MASRLEFTAGSFNIAGNRSILLGIELARSLGIRLGDEITLFSMNDLFGAEGVNTFIVTGLFRTGYYDYDTGLGFVNLETGLRISGEEAGLGIKIRNRWQDAVVMAEMKNVIAQSAVPFEKEPRLSTWRDYNRAFFGALRTEKLFMFILVGLIFVVVGLNIFQAQRRAVLERREEIGLLRAVGAGDLAVRLIFVWDGFLIGLIGAGAGMLLGILTAGHIAAVFGAVEGVINYCIEAVNYLSGSFSGMGNFAVFSPAVFYIKEIPARLIPGEVFLIFMFGFVSALLAAWFASGRVSRTRPAEVLRDE